MLGRFFLFAVLIFSALLTAVDAQSILATANGFSFTSNDLSLEARQLFEQQEKLIAENRRAVFEQWIFEELLAIEAKSRGTTAEKIQREAIALAAKPTEVQIKAVYDGNRQAIGNRSLEEVRHNIVEYLSRESAEKQMRTLFDSLKTKYKFASVKDVGSPVQAAEVVAFIGTRQMTAGEFELANKIQLYNYRAGISEEIQGDLDRAIVARLIEGESKKRGTDPSQVIAAEVTNKLKEFTDYERLALEDALQAKLFHDYAVKYATPPLDPQVLFVSADDDPSLGPATAKATVVAFVDFQCSACAAFSPLMKQVVSEFGSNVRLVIRDFPLTEIHEHAMNAALAGYAARQQNKFFELTDVMYRNQDALDDVSLVKHAASVGLNVEQFQRDMKNAAAASEVNKDIVDGKALGVNGTPAVFVNGIRLQRLSTARLRNLIQNALK